MVLTRKISKQPQGPLDGVLPMGFEENTYFDRAIDHQHSPIRRSISMGRVASSAKMSTNNVGASRSELCLHSAYSAS